MKKTIYFMLAACLFGFTSCLDENNGDSTHAYAGYFTVGHTDPNGIYTLYMDGGGIVEPTKSSVYDLTKSEKGLDKYERIYLEFSYKKENVMEGTDANKQNIVKNADLMYGLVIQTSNIFKTKEEAEVNNVLNPDSIHDVRSFSTWAYRGYLNLSINGSYGSEKVALPTASAYCDSIGENFASIKVLYNRHDSISYGNGNYLYSFRLKPMFGLVAGSKDSVDIHVTIDGVGTKKTRLPRLDLIPFE
ncbi:MAG: hypothetical protein KBT20_02850 [Bacteroidales bacterium]|nr:hypothetical protein [Candidatus Liminaster caballi]